MRTLNHVLLGVVLLACSAAEPGLQQEGMIDSGLPIRANEPRPSAPRPGARMNTVDAGRAPSDAVIPTPAAGTRMTEAGVDSGTARPRGFDRDAEVESDGGFDAAPLASIRYEGGDGSSCEMAVIIRGAASDFDAIGAEYAWLRAYYPGYTLLLQALSTCGERFVDIMQIRTASGMETDVYFDIDDSFGK